MRCNHCINTAVRQINLRKHILRYLCLFHFNEWLAKNINTPAWSLYTITTLCDAQRRERSKQYAKYDRKTVTA